MQRKNSNLNTNISREIIYTIIGIVVTLVAGYFLVRDLQTVIFDSLHRGDTGQAVQQIGFAAIFLFLIYGNLAYQLSRWGYLGRVRRHQRVPREILDGVFERDVPPLTILIPSYREETRVIRQSILSAALQDYPQRRVVLLIDDPPDPSDSRERRGLEETRQLPVEISRSLSEARARLHGAYESFVSRLKSGVPSIEQEIGRLARLHLETAAWFETQAARQPLNDHTDRLFVSLTFASRSEWHREQAASLPEDLRGLPVPNAIQRLRREYRHLVCLFDVEITSFQRKRYQNLSHAPNKAMNLNSYIGLMGGAYREVVRAGGLILEAADAKHASFAVPDTPFLITLDADSLLSPDYALRLVHEVELPGNERVAVAQTPYSSVPGALGDLERVAGATTDMQYIVHQGFTRHGATFWVGANALLRKSALEDIVVLCEERGFTIKKYIQDRTVIEDTESSVDLVSKGWQLYNYPERLSYSATPSDFGSLLIQRCRWANGGLLILPKLMRYLWRRPWGLRKWREGFLRVHYLSSIASANVGLLIILTYPLEKDLRMVWLPLTAAPYYIAYGRDLLQSGYRIWDLFRVYALNLLLIPVHLGGVLKSIQQGITGKQIAFKRTPKVSDRTPVPPIYLAAECLITAYCLLGALMDFHASRWWSGSFALINATIYLYGIGVFVGFAYGWQEMVSEPFGSLKIGFRMLIERTAEEAEG